MFTKESTPTDVVAKYPQASDVFKKYKINFCCKGGESIESQCGKNNIEVQGVVQELNKVYQDWQKEEARTSSLSDASLDELFEEVFLRHNQLIDELSILQQYVLRVNQVHGQEQPHLQRLESLYFELLDRMNRHIEEETILISLMKDEKSESEISLSMTKDKLQYSLDHIEKILNELKETTNNFAAPAHACGTYRVTYDRLNRINERFNDYISMERYHLLAEA